jgi:DNA-binding NarL/FixJ family response regulator
LVAANRFFRDSLVRLFKAQEDLPVLGADEFSPPTVAQILQVKPDIVVFSPVWHDTEFRGARAIRKATPRTKILMITMEDDPDMFLKAVRAGAAGYLLKDAPAREIVAAVRQLARDSFFCPHHLHSALFEFVATVSGSHSFSARSSPSELTHRERQVASLVVRGLTNKEIAARVNLSEQTVKNHVHSVLHKTRAKTRTALTHFAQHRSFPDTAPPNN